VRFKNICSSYQALKLELSANNAAAFTNLDTNKDADEHEFL
jgi:hypothetical protein